ncbi:hypothetical protein CBW65_21680 [Tumebacillus avium]|uniref:Uncharacterized protein n=1 Tax=Tumebacillus avium TaxID=1903704 RepID=A0A1Y0IRN4_9BACL|nr:hypothetical protein CBW65_21680 [Tumebacillus avium]
MLAVASGLVWVKPELPERMDLVGMLKTIGERNDQINEVNGEIAGKMSDIDKRSSTTERIGSQLQALRAGISEQDRSLAELDRLSQKQIELSLSLQELASTLHADLDGVGQGSAEQKAALLKMQASAKHLTELAAEIAQTNSAIAGKVSAAAQTSAEVADDMP